MRVIVTGSRDWDDFPRFSEVMDEMLYLSQAIHQDLWVAQGEQQHLGLDTWSREWGEHPSFKIRTYPSDLLLIEAGADMCVVFLRTSDLGTMDLINRARRKGIWTVVIHAEGRQVDVPAPVFQLPIPAPWPNLEVPDASLLKVA